MKIKLLFVCLFLCGLVAWTTDRTISGIVSDSAGVALPGVAVQVIGTKIGTTTDAKGHYEIKLPNGKSKLLFSVVGYLSKEMSPPNDGVLNVQLKDDSQALQEIVVTGYSIQSKKDISGSVSVLASPYQYPQPSVEEYASQNENTFHDAQKEPLTTFSIDVDRASYSNIRRYVSDGNLPPKDAIRVEEMINYFDYNYAKPTDNKPVVIHSEITDSPWNEGLKLLHIGLQAKQIPTENLPASNLVFLIDVSGSMSADNKLPLVKSGFKMLINQLRADDKVAIVVYAGAAGLVLPPTAGSDKTTIINALENLQAGGSTAGGAGIQLAYKTAKENFIKNGNNRIILASDGDFNVGVSGVNELEALVENERKTGVYLSVLGFGMGNYKDNKMEILADKGNGNYAYIDNQQEAHKTFVTEFGGTLFTIAKDVKFQLDFNPKFVQAYRLIGYENRALKNEDFNNDAKDAGEIGSGHTVTALYEIVPVGVKSNYFGTDKSKYQAEKPILTGNLNEVLTIKLRYKNPDEDKSQLIEKTVLDTHSAFDKSSENLRWAASVAELGLLLRKSDYKGKANYAHIIATAQAARGKDEEGHRAEFVKIVKTIQSMDKAE
jgi:Ca-activated chloride channel homolog